MSEPVIPPGTALSPSTGWLEVGAGDDRSRWADEQELHAPLSLAADSPSWSSLSAVDRQNLLSLVGFDPWSTEWLGNPVLALIGWGIDDPAYEREGLEELRLRLLKEGGTARKDSRWAVARPTRAREAPEVDLPPPPSTATPIPFPDLPTGVRSKQAREAHQRKRTFLEAIASGHTIRKAATLASIEEVTYRAWRASDPLFATIVDAQRAQHRAEVTAAKKLIGTADASSPPTRARVDGWDGTFASFRSYYFGYDTYPHHQLIIDAIESAPPMSLTVILLPPESGKSSLMEDYMCYKAATDPNHRTLIVSEAIQHARKILSTIKDRMTDPDLEDPEAPANHIPEFIARFGPFRDEAQDKDKPWNQNFIKVHKSSGRRDFTIQCCSWKSRIYGARTDLLIFDDMQSDASLNETDTMMQRIQSTFFSRVGKKGAMIYVGTRVGVGDVPESLIKQGMVAPEQFVQVPAVDTEGRSYCPQMWSEAELAVKRSMVGERGWWCNYMQQPKMAEAATFTEDMIAVCFDMNIAAGTIPDVGEGWRVSASIDPALGGGNAVTVGAWDDKHLRLLDISIKYGLARNEDIFEEIKKMTRYGFTELVVERNAMQRGLARDDRLHDLASTFGFTIVEHETGRNKWDFEFGVGAMAGSFLTKAIIWPRANEFSERRLEPLYDQLVAWRPGVPTRLLRQDGVMSLWFLWMHWQQQIANLDVDLSAWQSSATPWKPGDMSGDWAKQWTRSRVGV